jgi:hypothetical protein
MNVSEDTPTLSKLAIRNITDARDKLGVAAI